MSAVSPASSRIQDSGRGWPSSASAIAVVESRQSCLIGCRIRLLPFDTLPETTKRRKQAACARIIGQCAKERLGLDNAIEGRPELVAVQEQHSLLPQEREGIGALYQLEIRPIRQEGLLQRGGGGLRLLGFPRIDYCHQQVLELGKFGFECRGSLPPRQIR